MFAAKLAAAAVAAALPVSALTVAPASAARDPQTPPAVAFASAAVRTPAQRYVVNQTRFRGVGNVTTPPDVQARSWAVADLDTGRILAVHRQHRRLPQASTIKLLTAVTAARLVRRLPRHRVTRAEAHTICTCAGLHVGRRYTRRALLAGMLLPSGNDAAAALAGSYRRGSGAFVRAENREAVRLGAADTVVVTPSGLPARGAHSSAHDLLIFLRAAQATPAVERVLTFRSFRLGPVGGRTHRITRATDYVNDYPASEGKSGYTTQAQNTLVVSTGIDGHRIGVALLGAPYNASTSGARNLTLWVDANFTHLRRVGMLPPAPGPAVGAAATDGR